MHVSVVFSYSLCFNKMTTIIVTWLIEYLREAIVITDVSVASSEVFLASSVLFHFGCCTRFFALSVFSFIGRCFCDLFLGAQITDPSPFIYLDIKRIPNQH